MVRNYKPTGRPKGRPRKDGRPPKKGGYKARGRQDRERAVRKAVKEQKALAALPSVEVLHECFMVDSDGALVWKARPESHFRDAKNPSAMEQFNSKYPGRMAGALDRKTGKRPYVRLFGHWQSVEKIIAAMKEAGL